MDKFELINLLKEIEDHLDLTRRGLWLQIYYKENRRNRANPL